MRIRTKFIGILVIAAVVPLVVAMIAAQVFSYRAYRRAQGVLFATRAEHLAQNVGAAMNHQLESLDQWLALSGVSERVREISATQAGSMDEEFKPDISRIEAVWPKLDQKDGFVRDLLTNDLTARMRAFQAVNPLFVEVFITDAQGRVIAATKKPSSYSQAGQHWWQQATHMKPREAYVEGITYDPSNGAYFVEAAVSLRDPLHPDRPPAGIVKGIIHASPLLESSDSAGSGEADKRQVVLGNGQILAALTGPDVQPMRERIPRNVLKQITKKRSGWTMAKLRGEDTELVGFAPLRMNTDAGERMEVSGTSPMFVLISHAADVVLAPVRRQLFLLGLAGSVLVLGCAWAGYEIAGRKIIRPVERLRAAAQAVAASAKLDQFEAPAPVRLPILNKIRGIRTGDELEALARDFDYMASRVLTYHEHLEREIAEKTAEIDRDLRMARDFQEALMPREYPRIPSAPAEASICLNFHHVYKPASAVSGDFYDVLKLSDERAGIFIADVMGHGARSALVAAILRALLQDLAYDINEPAQFLTKLNRHFHGIVCKSNEVVFVSAFYLIIDTRTATATYASAGHPSPFLADRKTREIMPVIENLRDNPALGLWPDCEYSQWSRPVHAGDVFVLFTDGVFESYDAGGEEFGIERIRHTIAANLDRSVGDLSQSIVEALRRFIAPAEPADDICLLTVEVAPASAPALLPAVPLKA